MANKDPTHFGKKEIIGVLDQLSQDGHHETRKAIMRSIREQDKDEAQIEINLFNTTLLFLTFVAGITGKRCANYVLNNYFSSAS